MTVPNAAAPLPIEPQTRATFEQPLRGKQQSDFIDEAISLAVGGLHRTASAIAKVPTIMQAGLLAGRAIDEVLAKDQDIGEDLHCSSRST